MAKTFRPWDVDQGWLLPPSLHDFVPAGHLAHVIRDTVREGLDLSAIFACYEEERGYPPYHPAMMVALLLYGYSRGVYSSRQLARACEERVDFMAVTGLNRPDFRTISDFRKRHLAALGELFVQVLSLCRKAGLVGLGHVAIDGTKMRANASPHKAMSYGRMKQAEQQLAAEVRRWLAKAEAADASEDQERGTARRGDELPDWVANRQQRLERIRRAKAELEAEAASPPGDDDEPGPSSGTRDHGRPVRGTDGGPPDKAQRNFTDPDSRLQPSGKSFIQGYNAQVAVDATAQIIVAHRLTARSGDQAGLIPLVDATLRQCGQPKEVSADTGFCSEANLAALEERNIAGYVATGRWRHGTAGPTPRTLTKASRIAAMAEKLRRGGHRSRYRLRKQVVEPVFAQIKHARGFRQFLLREHAKVAAEWALICTVHNLVKLARATG